MFNALLSAIFRRQFKVRNCDELVALTNLADYYCALPVLSSCIDGLLFKEPALMSGMIKNACEILLVACKLRHKELFNDAFILTLGPWWYPQYSRSCSPLRIEDEDLFSKAHSEFCRITDLVSRSHMRLFNLSYDARKHPNLGHDLVDILHSVPRDPMNKMSVPSYFSKCYNGEYKDRDGLAEVQNALRALQKNNLSLHNQLDASPGQGQFQGYFLCVNVPKVPWNESQTDW